jgi:hypothetical protein
MSFSQATRSCTTKPTEFTVVFIFHDTFPSRIQNEQSYAYKVANKKKNRPQIPWNKVFRVPAIILLTSVLYNMKNIASACYKHAKFGSLWYVLVSYSFNRVLRSAIPPPPTQFFIIDRHSIVLLSDDIDTSWWDDNVNDKLWRKVKAIARPGLKYYPSLWGFPGSDPSICQEITSQYVKTAFLQIPTKNIIIYHQPILRQYSRLK